MLHVWMQDILCDTTTQFAGASYSELVDGLGSVMDANAFSSCSTRPDPRRGAVRVLRGAQVLKMSLTSWKRNQVRNKRQKRFVVKSILTKYLV